MPIGIEGKRVVVTGGARGIGAAAVGTLVSEGARVVSFDVTDDAGTAIAEAGTAAGPGTASFRHTDVSDRAEVEASLREAHAELGGLDAVLNIAGIERRAALEDMSEAELDEMLDVNLKGIFFMCQAAFPYLRDRGGSIVNFGSNAGLVPYPLGSHYSAAKAGVMALTRTASYEWGSYGIRVNSVAPAIWTPMYDEFRQRMSPDELVEHEATMKALIPLGGRLGDPKRDLAPVLVFLVSDASRFITGQIIMVDGGAGQVR
jgi:NAD(P)-dependent dehydrogenase (short-subunit alcohol dehydrogenase family)